MSNSDEIKKLTERLNTNIKGEKDKKKAILRLKGEIIKLEELVERDKGKPKLIKEHQDNIKKKKGKINEYEKNIKAYPALNTNLRSQIKALGGATAGNKGSTSQKANKAKTRQINKFPIATKKVYPGGKICITIDHLNADKSKWGLTSLDIAKRLVNNYKIPVTVFVSCEDNSCSGLDDAMIRNLHSLGVKLGIHTLGITASKVAQDANMNLIRNKIFEVTKKYPNVASYHGSQAGPHKNINLKKFKEIKFVRGVNPIGGGAFDTPVAPNQMKSLEGINDKKYTTFFFHSNELILLPTLDSDSEATKKNK